MTDTDLARALREAEARVVNAKLALALEVQELKRLALLAINPASAPSGQLERGEVHRDVPNSRG